MTLEEAINVDIVLMAAPVLKDDPKVLQALSLNIEALRRFQDVRGVKTILRWEPLPGETKD